MNQQPAIGDARLNRYARRAQDAARNAALIAKLALEPDTPKLVRTASYAADPVDLRGIPAVGRNCPGRINGTSPESICLHA
jgi:hypothetical protein